MRQLKLEIGKYTSKIIVGGRLKDSVSFFQGKRIVILADENVLHFHRESFPDLPVISIGSGEQSKSLDHAINIYRKLLNLELDRSSAIIGVGGGIATDLSGFIASTYMRGIPFGFVATTLLSQVDAAIGGKNGVNLDGYKNMIGLIRQPDFVICDLNTLSTLDNKEFTGGFSEIIKYGAIRHPELFLYLEDRIEEGREMKMDVLKHLVAESVQCKIDVVTIDENEEGLRKILNFGHTFGHAFEKLYKIAHGEAVAIGMVLAARMSVNLGMLHQSKAERLINLIRRSGLPDHLDFNADEVSEAMRKDKKRTGEKIQFVLLEDIGRAVIRKIDINETKSILHDLR